MVKCCICGFDFRSYEGIFSKKVFFCLDCWEERKKILFERKRKEDTEFLKTCSDAFNGLRKELKV